MDLTSFLSSFLIHMRPPLHDNILEPPKQPINAPGKTTSTYVCHVPPLHAASARGDVGEVRRLLQVRRRREGNRGRMEGENGGGKNVVCTCWWCVVPCGVVRAVVRAAVVCCRVVCCCVCCLVCCGV